MSRSYRKPYATICGSRSAAADKRVARRNVRHKQNQAIREAFDWEEFVLPKRYECAYNDVRGWARDGKQRPQKICHNDLNPFFAHRKDCDWSLDEILEWHFESLERQYVYIEKLKRK